MTDEASKDLTTPPETSTEMAMPFQNPAAFKQACQMARALCSSQLVPKEYQGEANLGSAVIALEISQRLGVSPLMVMQNLDIIHGRPSWRAQMVIGMVNSCGRFGPLRYDIKEGADVANPSCSAHAQELPTGDILNGPVVDLEMAKAEGWYGKQGSKWKTMPSLMLRYRAAAFWARTYAPELLMGLPTVEESLDREPIDVTPAGPFDTTPPNGMPNLSADYDISEWPKRVETEDGHVWIDSENKIFDADLVAWSAVTGKPSVRQDGSFRKRQGVSADKFSGLGKLAPPAEDVPDNDDIPSSQSTTDDIPFD